MSQTDVDYYTQRERAERERAERADDAGARHAHLAMAEVYAQRVKTMAATPAIPLR
ncbi:MULTISPECIES: hypothetical protein [unclassified Sphingomonas]|uniref:hypothetical protein n=1 Tax=unclassified Sphingomonas TaxID=196159 RepID=UPI002151157F|nr:MULTISPECIES: hypothetical protein [unclassified Sphingomonas]MCR5870773.1 hypothetical protein [Sphingomonas sp. J344]UUY00893.1 hypothetical protein LRS08_07475 [Sphingomonas sp. J315]